MALLRGNLRLIERVPEAVVRACLSRGRKARYLAPLQVRAARAADGVHSPYARPRADLCVDPRAGHWTYAYPECARRRCWCARERP